MFSKYLTSKFGLAGVLTLTAVGGVLVGVVSAQQGGQAQAPRPPQTLEQPVKERQIFSFKGKRPVQGHSEVALSNFDTEGRMTLQDEVWAADFNVPAHFHKKHTEVFYVVSGQVEWTVNGETHVLGAGDLVLIPTNTPHAVKTVGGKEAHMLMIYEPGGYEEDSMRESLFTAEARKDPKVAKALADLGDFHPTTMPTRAK